jgi:hypothetical protein
LDGVVVLWLAPTVPRDISLLSNIRGWRAAGLRLEDKECNSTGKKDSDKKGALEVIISIIKELGLTQN